MTVIIGGRQSILMQIPKEVREEHPRLDVALTSDDAQEMLKQSIEILSNPDMRGSHILFADIIRLILALQLSVAESNFK